MKHPRRQPWILSLAFAVVLNGYGDTSAKDPFADPPEGSLKSPGKAITLNGGEIVSPHKQWNLPEDRWPKIDPPIIFNRLFKKPSKVWYIEPGYFASFDAGEFGAGLFYSPGTDPKWLRVVDAHIQDLIRFSDDNVLAVGGIAHLTHTGGAAFLIRRRISGTWGARKVFASGFGIPELWGDYSSPLDGGEKAYATIRLKMTLEDSEGLGPTFAITSRGTTYYLGVESQPQSEPDGAGQPATRPLSK